MVTIEANEGENLMDVLLNNNTFGSELEEFGLCEKKLACHTCRVNIIKGYDALTPPAVDEEDVFD